MRLILSLAVLLLSVLPSCVTKPQRDVHISIESTAAPRVHVLSYDCFVNDSGTLTFVMELKNCSREYTEFEYRVDWLRDGSIPVDTLLSNWKAIGLAGEEVAWIKLPAPNAHVSDYRFHLRRVIK